MIVFDGSLTDIDPLEIEWLRTIVPHSLLIIPTVGRGREQEVQSIIDAYRTAAENLDRKAVFIASGDLSHKLREDSPYGFASKVPGFDRRITEAMTIGYFLHLDVRDVFQGYGGEQAVEVVGAECLHLVLSRIVVRCWRIETGSKCRSSFLDEGNIQRECTS